MSVLSHNNEEKFLGKYSPGDLLMDILQFLGEKVLCFHGPLLYEAKCLDVKSEANDLNWDEWVSDKRMCKYDDTNLKRQKELEKIVKSGKKIKPLRRSDLKARSEPPAEVIEQLEKIVAPSDSQQAASLQETYSQNSIEQKSEPLDEDQTKPQASDDRSVTVQPQSSRRRKIRMGPADNSLESEGSFLKRINLNILLPDELKAWLVDDWDLITRQSRLYDLPAAHPVVKILNDFLSYQSIKNQEASELKKKQWTCKNSEEPPSNRQQSQKNIDTLSPDLYEEFIAGLQHYFNTLLGSHLLYKFERLQYADLLKKTPDKRLSEIYGPIHLLRMFVKLRDMISCTRVDLGSLAILEVLLKEFLQFLDRSVQEYYRLEFYTVATAEYQRRSMC